MSGDKIFTATVPPSARIGLRRGGRLLWSLGKRYRRDGNIVGAQEGVRLQWIEPPAPILESAGNNPSRASHIGRKRPGQAVRHLREIVLGLAIAHQVHDALHGLGFCAEVRDAGALKCLGWPRSSPSQTANTGFLRCLWRGRASIVSTTACAGRRRARERRRYVHDEHGVICLVGQKCFERARIARRVSSPMMSTGLARDHVGGSSRSSFIRISSEIPASVPPRSISRSTRARRCHPRWSG